MQRWAISFALLFSIQAFGASDCLTDFQNKSREIPLRLLKMGYKRFGSLDLEKFLHGTKKVKIYEGEKLLGKMDLRSTARWEVSGGLFKTRKITVDCAWWNKYPEQKAILALHEQLSVGASGEKIDDTGYWKSNGLWLLTLDLTHKALKQNELKALTDWLKMDSGGGVVGVGGGGEIASIKYKTDHLIRSLKNMRAARSQEKRSQALVEFVYWLENNVNFIETERLYGSDLKY